MKWLLSILIVITLAGCARDPVILEVSLFLSTGKYEVRVPTSEVVKTFKVTGTGDIELQLRKSELRDNVHGYPLRPEQYKIYRSGDEIPTGSFAGGVTGLPY